MLKHLALLLPILLTSCHSWINRTNDRILSCGPEAKDFDGQLVKVNSLVSPDGSNAAFVSSAGEQRSLRLTSRGCVVVPADMGQGWLVVRSHVPREQMGIISSKQLVDREQMDLEDFVIVEREIKCPLSAGRDTWYGRSDKDLEFFEQELAPLYYRYQLKPDHVSPLAPVPLSNLEASLRVSLKGMASGPYQLAIAEFDFSRIPASIQKRSQLCSIYLDEIAPKPARAFSLLPRSIGRNELVDLSAIDSTTTRVRFCWQEDKGEEASCEMQDQNSNITRVPKAGKWLLSYEFEDAAGNRSPRIVERYSTENVVDSLRDMKQSYQQALENYDSVSALLQVVSALKKKSLFQMSDEILNLGRDFMNAFIRLALTGTSHFKFSLDGFDSFELIPGGYLIIRHASGAYNVEKYSLSHQLMASASFGKDTFQHNIYHHPTQQFVAWGRDEIEIHDIDFKLVDKFPVPEIVGRICYDSDFDSILQRVMVLCRIESSSDDHVFIFDRKGQRQWLEAGKTMPRVEDEERMGKNLATFVGDGSSFFLSLPGLNASYLFASDNPALPKAEYAETLLSYDSIFWKRSGCVLHRSDSSLRCFDNANPDQDLMVLSDVTRIQWATNQRFLTVEKSGNTSALIDLENLAAEWSRDFPFDDHLMSATHLNQDAVLVQGRSGTIFAAENPDAELTPIFYMVSKFNNSQRKPFLMATSPSCEMAFYTFEGVVIAIGLKDGHIQPFQSFKIVDATDVYCAREQGVRRIAIRNEKEEVFLFDDQQHLLQTTPRAQQAIDDEFAHKSVIGTPDGKFLVARDGFGADFSDCLERSCQLVVDTFFANRRAIAVDHELHMIDNGEAPRLVQLEDTLHTGVFANAETFVVNDESGRLLTIDVKSGQPLAVLAENKHLYSKILPLKNGAFFAAAVDYPATRLLVFRTADLGKVLDLDAKALGLKPNESGISIEGGPQNKSLALTLGNHDVWLASVDDIVQGTYKPQNFVAADQLQGVVLDEANERVFAIEQDRLIIGNDRGQVLKRVEGPSVDQFAWIAATGWHFTLSGTDMEFATIRGDGSEMIKEKSGLAIHGMGVVNNTLYAVSNDRMLSLPLDEAEFLRLGCLQLKDYLAHGQGLSEEQRHLCDY